jgi:hypothetical protein
LDHKSSVSTNGHLSLKKWWMTHIVTKCGCHQVWANFFTPYPECFSGSEMGVVLVSGTLRT